MSADTKIVSIRTRSFDRVMRRGQAVAGGLVGVSIRTRSFDRVMLRIRSPL